MGQVLQASRKKVDLVVLMAGVGKRMGPYTADKPKALITCEDGRSIFHHIIQAFASQNWDLTVIPVIGHGIPKVNEEILRLKSLAEFKSVHNPFYATAGPLVSLWLGLMQSSNDSVVVLNGDTLIHETLVDRLSSWMEADSSGKHELGLCASKASFYSDDDMKIVLDDYKNFVKVKKDIPSKICGAKSTGVFGVKDAISKDLLKLELNKVIMDKDSVKKNYSWHNILNEVNGKLTVNLIEVNLESWYEIDTPEEFKLMTESQELKINK